MINRVRYEIKKKNPLIHCITNPISITQCANLILSAGGSPVMAEHPEEAEEITKTADALLLNTGNITDVRMRSILISGITAKKNNIPMILDAVGVACSKLRRNYIRSLFAEFIPDIIKGNYSEITALDGEDYNARGVDADKNIPVEYAAVSAVSLAKKYKCIILASGKTDIITDGKRTVYVKNGCEKLGSITGTGCMLGAFCAACLSVSEEMDAAIAASVIMGICGELADESVGAGSFAVSFFDSLSSLSEQDIERLLKMEEIYEKY